MPWGTGSGLGVSNFYGPRDTGGTEGVTKTEGVMCEFMKDLTPGAGLDFGFPVPWTGQDSVWVTEVDVSQVTGHVAADDAQTIGGVNVKAATEEAPVEITSSNTGVIVIADATGGKVLIKYKKYPL